jgi:hypothetical protein
MFQFAIGPLTRLSQSGNGLVGFARAQQQMLTLISLSLHSNWAPSIWLENARGFGHKKLELRRELNRWMSQDVQKDMPKTYHEL